MVRFQIKPFRSVSDSDFKSNRFFCQEIKSLKFRINLISILLKRIEFDKKEYEKIFLISSLSCVVNIYIYMHVLYVACAHKPKIFFFAEIIELNRSFSKHFKFCKSDENWARLLALKLKLFATWCSWCSR